VVAYDRQGQRALARTISSQISSYSRTASDSADGLGALLAAWFGGKGGGLSGVLGYVASPLALAPASLLLAGIGLLWLRRKGFVGRGSNRGDEEVARAVVEFYERMAAALGGRGLVRRTDQTPLEFAEAVGTPEVLAITEAYNRVRYGAHDLTRAEAEEVERHLQRIVNREP
jgi:hypothetical protein